MSTPFFSIIVPVYNGEQYIVEAIEGVLQQTEQDWELILIDDASKDRTLEISEFYAQLFEKIKVLKNPRNLNIARSLNRGILMAQGQWMVRLDSDDYFNPDYLKILRFTIENEYHNPDCFFSSWVTVVDGDGRKVLDVRLPEAQTIQRMMPIENFLYHPATCFSKRAWEKVGGYPIRDRTIAEDTAMWLKFIRAGVKLVMIPRCLVNYRVHHANLTSKNDAKLFCEQDGSRELKARRQYCEWRISLFLKQQLLKKARQELLALWDFQKKITLKNLHYYFLTFMPKSVAYLFMWQIRPWLRAIFKELSGRHVRV